MATVLVVEDEVNIANVVRIALERDGYRVIAVRTGEEALAELPRHPIALVVLDLGLPGMDGLEVCRRIRAGSSLPIIMLTARADHLAFADVTLSRSRRDVFVAGASVRQESSECRYYSGMGHPRPARRCRPGPSLRGRCPYGSEASRRPLRARRAGRPARR
jgi:CheY-like chemotaxis protein